MGTTTSPTMASPGPPTMDKFSPTSIHQRLTNQQHILFQLNSHTMVRRFDNMELEAIATMA